MYYPDVINKACISLVKVQEYAKDNALNITSSLKDMGVSVYEHLKRLSEGTFVLTKRARYEETKSVKDAVGKKPPGLTMPKPVE